MTIRVNSVEVINPPMTAMAIGAWDSDPDPTPIAIGSMPKIIESVVIRMGLSLSLPPSQTASASASGFLGVEGIDQINEQNSVFGHKPHQHDDSDHREDAHRLSEKDQSAQGSDQGEGKGKHDDERVEEAFKLRGQNHVDDHDCQ